MYARASSAGRNGDEWKAQSSAYSAAAASPSPARHAASYASAHARALLTAPILCPKNPPFGVEPAAADVV
jgi:hypothetical protein